MTRWGRRGRNKHVTGALVADAQPAAETLNRVLERERSRADRSGRSLSLVLIGFDGRRSGRADASVVLEVMQARSRSTDVAGRFDRRTAFAVLPDTSAAGARVYADRMRRKLSRQGVRTSFAIYAYTPADPARQQDDERRGGGGTAGTVGALPERRGQGADRRHHAALRPAVAAVGAAGHDVERTLEPALTLKTPLWKRGLDVAVAGSLLAAVWPLMVGIGVAIRLDSRGPAMFLQQRAGLGGKPFWIYKFRTMRPDAELLRDRLRLRSEQDGPAFKLRQDPRITRVGRLLRRTSLDELPQLLNILRGEMTLVGPRPLPMHESNACAAWQRRRLAITPGLTCIWQVRGRSTVSFDQWCRMDLAYLRNRTLLHDVKILAATVPAVVRQRGAC